MKLTRVLERRLGDGQAIVVSRSWRVRFVPHAGGYRVEGEQIAVAVETPPRLARLAEVERNKPQGGDFPILLDAAGRIVGNASGSLPAIPGLGEAVRAFVADRDDARRDEALQYVAAVQQAGAAMASRWPPDLFFPAASREERRELPLPGGGEGAVQVRFEGTLDGTGKRLATARRRIVTRVGESERISLETWRLEPLD
ncbi:hypothetical protein V5F89_03820 [Pelagerythrobacter marensis]|uniref:Uncharacterized protein n=1 Tax=Pelagerythrobacter marensis TaxID=543877 RepID=A0ABZ2DCI2_9SPHN